MSYLIDSFKGTDCEINGKWWVSKPLLNTTIKTKIKWIMEILKGKAIAVHFKEDEDGKGQKVKCEECGRLFIPQYRGKVLLCTNCTRILTEECERLDIMAGLQERTVNVLENIK